MGILITGIILFLLSIWLVSLAVYATNTGNRLGTSLEALEKFLLPKLKEHQLPDVAVTLQNIVIPRWKAWVKDITGFQPTLLIFTAISVLIGTLVLVYDQSSYWYDTVLIGIFALTAISAASIARTTFLIGLGCELVYNTVWALGMDQKTISEHDKNAIEQFKIMIRDDDIWDKLTSGKTTRTIEV